ncbi:MAG: AarF/ABC1/UbiB kinase family protein [Atopobiaceae bacterium]|nr:AarF/ABC1/UbiB kinase family protein [Atopobiaceae bacterium]
MLSGNETIQHDAHEMDELSVERQAAVDLLEYKGDYEELTISIFGKRKRGPRSSRRYKLSRAGKRARLREIFGIARKYQVTKGITPVKLRHMFEEMGPTFVKVGQVLSMRSEILPEPFCTELSKLRSDVDPMPTDLVRVTLQAEYDQPIDEIFSSIDPEPLGSASVAQVHKAQLVTGEVVAIKLQRPKVQEVMAQDIDIMRTIVRRAKGFLQGEQVIDLEAVVEELWETFVEETDFLVESKNLEEFRQNNEPYVFVNCPKPYLGLCTEHVVVMEYIEGIPLHKTAKLLEGGYDLSEIGTKLTESFATQLLDDGFFHADPHPGNILISGGQIVFIDLGIMGRLSSSHRKILTDMMAAVAMHDSPALMNALLRFAPSKDPQAVDYARLLSDIDGVLDDFGTTNLSDLDLGGFLTSLIQLANRQEIEIPVAVTSMIRGLINLEGVVDEFLPGVSMVDVIAAHVAASDDLSQRVRQDAASLVVDSRAATKGLMGAASQAGLAMNMLTRGQIKVNLDMVGSEYPIDELARLGDRLSMGIIVAGLFVGSSIVYYARMEPVILGIPLLGFIGYACALILALRIGWDIFQRDRRRR